MKEWAGKVYHTQTGPNSYVPMATKCKKVPNQGQDIKLPEPTQLPVWFMASLLSPTNIPQAAWIDNIATTLPPASSIGDRGYSRVKLQALMEQHHRAEIVDISGPMPAHDAVVVDPCKN
eukprot:14768793-Ditylum_brightwellii.AAC.1